MAGVNRALVMALLLAAAVSAGCGGGNGDGGGTTVATPPTAGPITVTTPEDTAQAEATPTGKPTFIIRLTAESATPTAGRPWRYTVRAMAKSGGSAGGTAKMRVFVDDELVDTIGFFAFDDTLSRTHKWPTVLKGKKGVVLQAEVEGDGGTQRANYPVTVN
jgi:hypothetical protein